MMALAATITVPQTEINRAVRRLDGIKGGVGKAVSGAINDLMKTGRTQVARQVTSRVVVPYGSVLRRVKITRASEKNLTATLRVDEKSRPGLVSFGAKDTKRRGVTYRISKQEGRKRIADAFIARGKARGATSTAGMAQRVFKRAGPKRKPLLDLKGPSINRVITRNEIDATVANVIRRELPRRVDARVNLLIQRTLR
jgi:hypothetical protein